MNANTRTERDKTFRIFNDLYRRASSCAATDEPVSSLPLWELTGRLALCALT